MGLSIGEIVLIIAVILLLFGASKLPELARSLGKAMSEFKKGVSEGAEDKPSAKKPAQKKKSKKKK